MSKVIISSAAPDLFPSPVYVAKGQAGATSGDVLITSSATYTLFDLPPNVYVQDVGWKVASAFTADVDLTIGVSTGAADFAAVADVDATTADANIVRGAGLIAAAQAAGTGTAVPALSGSGFLVPSTGDVISVTVNTASAATGLLDVYVWYVYLDGDYMPESTRRERLKRTHQFRAGL